MAQIQTVDFITRQRHCDEIRGGGGRRISGPDVRKEGILKLSLFLLSSLLIYLHHYYYIPEYSLGPWTGEKEWVWSKVIREMSVW